MTRDAAVSKALNYYDDAARGYFADISRYVTARTESQNPERLEDLAAGDSSAL